MKDERYTESSDKYEILIENEWIHLDKYSLYRFFFLYLQGKVTVNGSKFWTGGDIFEYARANGYVRNAKE
jgi:hypothetical protein